MPDIDQRTEEVITTALRETGLQADRDTAQRLLTYLKQSDAHIHVGGSDGFDITEWKPLLESAVASHSPSGGADMIRFSATTDNGGFAFICLPRDADGQKVMQSLEQQFGSGRR